MDYRGEHGGAVRNPDLTSGAVLSLDQIRAIRACNEYTEGPAVACRQAPDPRAPPRPTDKQERTHEVIRLNVNNNYERRQLNPLPSTLIRTTSTGSAASVSSDVGLLTRSAPARSSANLLKYTGAQVVWTQPKSLSSSPHPFLPPKVPLKQTQLEKVESSHLYICERCGKCKCSECTAPQPFPSCLACNGQCLCSVENVVEHGTCMCLVKGMFYHCSNEDDVGDPCADQPCSLSNPRCCSRFLCMSLASVLFPCVLCYLPAEGCVKACHSCHDRLNRPGCRCKNSNTVYCKLQSWNHTPGKPS